MIDNSPRLGLFLMTKKGLWVLKSLLEVYNSQLIAFIVTARDLNTYYDAYEEITHIAKTRGIVCYNKSERKQKKADVLLAVSWRWLIKPNKEQDLIIFHDSLLPKYRGFLPLVSALVNGDKKIGVSAIFATESYDCGPIISQQVTSISYPITIAKAIENLLPCYEELARDVINKLLTGDFNITPQEDSEASYSLWRDDRDYYVDWSWPAEKIQRFVDAVGFPYKGAAITIENKLYRLRECKELPDVIIMNRSNGKVIFFNEDKPVIVCGEGLLEIIKLTEDDSEINILPLSRFRLRFDSL